MTDPRHPSTPALDRAASMFSTKIDLAVIEAGKKMDCSDVSPDMSDEECELVYEQRFHCGTCVTRAVMETVWPPIEEYIEWLEQLIVAQGEPTQAKKRWWQR